MMRFGSSRPRLKMPTMLLDREPYSRRRMGVVTLNFKNATTRTIAQKTAVNSYVQQVSRALHEMRELFVFDVTHYAKHVAHAHARRRALAAFDFVGDRFAVGVACNARYFAAQRRVALIAQCKFGILRTQHVEHRVTMHKIRLV